MIATAHAQDKKVAGAIKILGKHLQLRENPRLVSEHRLAHESSRQSPRSVRRWKLPSLKKVRAQLDKSFAVAVETIVEAVNRRGKIVVVGIGKSGNVGQKIAATLTSTGSTSVVLNSVDALHGDLGIVNDGDVILALSYSGESEELLNLLPALKRFSVKIISFTGNLKSSLAKYSDVSLNVKVPKEACPFNLAPTTSTTAMLVMGDALAMAVLQARGFKQKDFAKHHPGGAIGRAMLLRVGDIMRSGERNAIARGKFIRQGSAAGDDAREIRQLERGQCARKTRRRFHRRRFPPSHGERRQFAFATAKKSDDAQTRSAFREDALAVEALKIFNERNIDDLIVVNAKHEPVGLVDSQDLPKLKIM